MVSNGGVGTVTSDSSRSGPMVLPLPRTRLVKSAGRLIGYVSITTTRRGMFGGSFAVPAISRRVTSTTIPRSPGNSLSISKSEALTVPESIDTGLGPICAGKAAA